MLPLETTVGGDVAFGDNDGCVPEMLSSETTMVGGPEVLSLKTTVVATQRCCLRRQRWVDGVAFGDNRDYKVLSLTTTRVVFGDNDRMPKPW